MRHFNALANDKHMKREHLAQLHQNFFGFGSKGMTRNTVLSHLLKHHEHIVLQKIKRDMRFGGDRPFAAHPL
jgi:hypothetical protein